jgi:class 3 adenylate cyclase
MLASMSEIDPRADAPLVDWSGLGVSGLLPTGTVTLVLADVEGSTRLWETQPGEMTAALARLNQAVSDIVATHDGVRPVEQGEGDSFVAAFARASDAVAAALALQRAPLAPIRLRIGVHSGEIQLRDEGNYAGPTINRTARLRDLGHGGQTLLSGATEQLVVDRLPDGAWVTDLGTHLLRDLPRPERVVQLCHPDLVNECASLLWLARRGVTVKPSGSSARPTPFANAWARFASRCGTPVTKTLWRSYEMPWARLALTLPGPRALRYRAKRRLPTPSAAAADANDPPAAGPRSPPPNATSCDWSARGSAITTSPQGFSSHRVPCNPTSPTSTPSWASHLACSWPRKRPATPDHCSGELIRWDKRDVVGGCPPRRQ